MELREWRWYLRQPRSSRGPRRDDTSCQVASVSSEGRLWHEMRRLLHDAQPEQSCIDGKSTKQSEWTTMIYESREQAVCRPSAPSLVLLARPTKMEGDGQMGDGVME